MVTGRAQALGTKNEASACHQAGTALWRHLSLLLPAMGEQSTHKTEWGKSPVEFGIALGDGESQD